MPQVISLKPVLASYVRAVDGWRVPVDKATGLVKPAAEAYIIDESFKLPDPVVDEDKYQQYLEEYEELKWRLLRETLLHSVGDGCKMASIPSSLAPRRTRNASRACWVETT